MESKSSFLYICEGVLRAFFLTLILLIVLSFLLTFVDLSSAIRSASFVFFTSISIIYGAVYSTKKIRNKGFLVGIAVAVLYTLIIFIVSIVSGSRGFSLGWSDLFRVILALLVGMLSGMLGINV